MVRFWNCALLGCPNAAAVDYGGCEQCRSMYCAVHADPVLHSCEASHNPLTVYTDDDTWLAAQTAELAALHKKTNATALIQRATELSGGLRCRLDEEDDPLGRRRMGGMHVHREILFEDGSVWLARILRQNYTSFDDELSNQILLSECATLRWLEPLDISTPKLHGFGLRGDPQNKVGVAYMLIDKLPGRPFDPHAASEQQKAKVLGQWTGILCTLGQHPIDKIGSLQFADDDKTISVGPIASDRTGTLPRIGPFENAGDFYVAWAGSYQDLIIDGQLFSRYPTDAYLMFRFLADQIRTGAWLSRWDQTLSTGPFFLKHADDKGDHILVDDDYHITGIIDWTFARAVPAYDAFGPSLVSVNTDDLFTGKTGLSENDRVLGSELQQRGAPYCFFETDEMRRFTFGLGMGLGLSKDESIAVFQCLVATFDGAVPNWPEWRKARIDHWTDDPRLPGVIPVNLPEKQVPRFATCSLSQCDRPSVRGRSCQTCRRHLCALHIRPKYHTCPSTSLMDDSTWEKGINNEVEALLAQVCVPELVRRASSLRGGEVSCSFQPGRHLGDGAIMGCANYHAWINFDDGVRWLARIPRTTAFSDIPADLVDYLVESEYATLRFLESLSVPTPRAHGYGLAADPDNLVGVAYILEDAMPGRPFYAHEATEEQKRHVYSQYAGILSEIRRHPMDQACSLVPDGAGGTRAAAIASNRFLSLGKHGPFSSPQQYFSSIADLHLDLVTEGQIYPEYPKEAFLFYRLLREWAACELALRTCDVTGFFLKHVDDKGDHLLVDDNYNITAVIDWQFARFVPACEAFGPSLFTADMGKLYGGESELGKDDLCLTEIFQQKGERELCKWARDSDLARRFHFGLASGLARDEVIAMMGAVLSYFDDTLTETELQRWMKGEWHMAVVDPRRARVEKLVAELEREGTA